MIVVKLTSRRIRLVFTTPCLIFIAALSAMLTFGAEPAKQIELGAFVVDSDIRFRQQPPDQAPVKAISDYAFNETPADALQVLQQLKAFSHTNSRGVALEHKLVEDVMDGRLDDFSYADAALIASGVFDVDRRRRYLDKIQAVTTQASDATADLNDEVLKAKSLLIFLHEKVLKRGYMRDQTRLDRLLDRGHYNCVSSAVIYNLVGVELGLELSAVEVPDHALSIFYKGDASFDVETTSRYGFAPSNHARQKFEAVTGYNYTPDSDKKQRREISTLNLIGMIYYNQGVDYSEREQYSEALNAYFKALSFDKKSNSSVKNILAVLVNWSGQLVKAQEFEQALKVINVGLILAPEDLALKHQHKHAWSERVRYSLQHGSEINTAAFALQAYNEFPGEDFEQLQAWVFEQLALKAIKVNEYARAWSMMETTLQRVPTKIRVPLHNSRIGLLRHAASQLIDASDFDQAEKILKQGLVWYPEHKLLGEHLHYLWEHRARLAIDARQWGKAANIYSDTLKTFPSASLMSSNLPYLVQAWVADDKADAQNILINILERFPDDSEFKSFIQKKIHYSIQTLVIEGAHDDALSWLNTDNLLTKDTSESLMRLLYFRWAETFSDRHSYEQAISIYQRGLAALPGDKAIMQNMTATWHSWAERFMDAGDWREAIRLYKLALKTSQHPSLLNNLRYCEEQLILAG